MAIKKLFPVLALLFLSCKNPYVPQTDVKFGLPCLYLFISQENLSRLNSNVFSNIYVNATLKYENTDSKAQVTYQGYTGKEGLKKSYKVKFPDESKIILSSQQFDPSLCRYHIALNLFKKAGLLTHDIKHISLFLNGEYKGVYCLMEPVDENFLKKRNRCTGNLYKIYNNFAKFSLKDGYNVRNGFRKEPIDDDNYSDLEEFFNVLDSTPPEQLKETLDRILDVHRYLHYLAISITISNWDDFNKDFYLYNRDYKSFEVIPWDLDYTFTEIDPAFEDSLFWANNLNKKLLEVPEYKEEYKSIILNLLEEDFTENILFSEIDSIALSIKEAYKEDVFLKNNNYNLEDETNYIKTFITKRKTFVQKYLLDL